MAVSGGKLRALVGPAYLLACLLLGGSTQTVWLSLILQLIALMILSWAVVEWQQRPLGKEVHQLLWFAGAMVALVAIHLLPLPPALWGALPGREPVVDGLKLLGLKPGWQPLSLAPYDTITAGRARADARMDFACKTHLNSPFNRANGAALAPGRVPR